MRVTVDQRLCQSYVCCVMEAPEVFDIGADSGTVVLLCESPDERLREKVAAAVRSCPTRAIEMRD